MYRAVCLFLLCTLNWFVSLVDAYKEHFTVMDRRDVFDVRRKGFTTSIGPSGCLERALGRGFASLKRCFCWSIVSGTRQLSGGIMGFCAQTCFFTGSYVLRSPQAALWRLRRVVSGVPRERFFSFCVRARAVCAFACGRLR